MNNQHSVRVRFAPSPTGHLHIGGLRSAYFNWLFARHEQGVFLLRIEDTDLERSKKEYFDSILDAFAWCGIISDEPLVIQSQRKERHLQVAHLLLEQAKAYKCFCTPDELAYRLGANAQTDGYVRYDEKCRNLSAQEQLAYADHKTYAIRFKVDKSQHISWNDAIRGHIAFESDQLDDFIIVRSDGSPMYNFVVVVDDADMNITHVIRGDDHISNTPKQILLYNACGFNLPLFGHVPMILGADGQRLSKRHAATSVLEYRSAGFLAEALCNYLVRLGWAAGDKEIFTQDELIALFTLQGVNKKGAIFDPKKLEWVNSVHMKAMDDSELISRIVRDIDEIFVERLCAWSPEQLRGAIRLYKERTVTLRALMQAVENVYVRPRCIQEDVDKQAYGYIQSLLERLEVLSTFERNELESIIKELCQALGIKLGQLLPAVRKALTGFTDAPSVYDLLVILGKEESLIRLRAFCHNM